MNQNHSFPRFAFPLLMGALLAACGSNVKPSSSAASNASAPSSSQAAATSSSSPAQTPSSPSSEASASSEGEDDRKPFETMEDTTETSGVYAEGVSLDLGKLSRVDQCADSDKRGVSSLSYTSYTSIKKDDKRVNAVYFSQSNPASTYWAGTDGNKRTYPEGSGLYNNNGYSEFRFAKTFASEITGTMSVEFDYVLTNTNVTTPAEVEAAKAGATGTDNRENDGTYVAQYAAKMTADGTEWLNGANLDEASYTAGENGYTVTGFFENDEEWHHTKIQRAITSKDGTVTFKLYHWVGQIALTNISITAE